MVKRYDANVENPTDTFIVASTSICTRGRRGGCIFTDIRGRCDHGTLSVYAKLES